MEDPGLEGKVRMAFPCLNDHCIGTYKLLHNLYAVICMLVHRSYAVIC